MAMASLAAHGEVEAQRVERLEARQPRAAKNQAVNVRKGQRDMCAMPAEQTMSRVCGAAGFSGRKHRRVRRGEQEAGGQIDAILLWSAEAEDSCAVAERLQAT